MAVTNVGSAYRTTRVPYRLSIESAGLLTLLLGAWVGIVAYVAPVFGFSADGTTSWTWNFAHSLRFLAPGAGAFLAGLIIMVEGLSSGPARRALLGSAGFLGAVVGAWLVVGPFAWSVLEGSTFFAAAASPLREFAYWIGYSVGPGGLLLAFGAFVLGRPRTNWRTSDT